MAYIMPQEMWDGDMCDSSEDSWAEEDDGGDEDDRVAEARSTMTSKPKGPPGQQPEPIQMVRVNKS